MSSKSIFYYNLFVGLLDSFTGALLITFPALTLTLMHISRMPLEDVYLRFIGVFVLGTGVVYLLPYTCATNQQESVQFSWRYTSIVRSIVCLFVSFQCLRGVLEPAWMIVASTDGLLAILQIFYLARLRDPLGRSIP